MILHGVCSVLRRSLFFLILPFLSASFVNADSSSSREKWHLSSQVLAGAKAKFDEPGMDEQRLRYSQGKFEASYHHYIDDKTAIVPTVGYRVDKMQWKENPFFDTETFRSFKVGIGGFSRAVEGWLWQGGLQVSMDTEEWSLSHYAQYQLGVAGRYGYSSKLGIHIGFLGKTGLHKDQVLPVLGVDYAWSNQWKLSLIFPRDVSLIYTFNDSWTAGVRGRVFRSRHRVGEDEALSKAIFEYRNVGAEASLRYKRPQRFSAQLFVGATAGGDLKIMNQKGRNPTFRSLKTMGYGGADLTLSF